MGHHSIDIYGLQHMLDPVGYHSIECRGEDECPVASIAFAAGFTETSACCAWGMPCNWIDLGCSLDEVGWVVVFSVLGHHSIDIYRLQTHVGPCGIPFYRVQMWRWVPRNQHCFRSRFHRDLSLLCLRHALQLDRFGVLVGWTGMGCSF